MCEADIVPSAGPKLFTFLTALKQQLTGLTIAIDPDTFKAHHCLRHLGALAMLPALQELGVESARSGFVSVLEPEEPYLDLLGEELVLKLPHLVSFRLEGIQQGKLILACPELAEVELSDTRFLNLNIGDAILASLKLKSCEGVQVIMDCVGKQLQNLECLVLSKCGKVGRELIGYVSKLKHLQELEYTAFPTACMPQRFPQSLVRLSLAPSDWRSNVPKGLKKLHRLKDLTFRSDFRTWAITRPLAELLPTKSLQNLTLESRKYICEGAKAEWVDTHMPCLMHDS